MISLQLAPDEAAFLEAQLQRHVEHVENELVHTDHRRMQRELASDLAKVRELLERLGRASREDRSSSETTMSPDARSGAV